MQFLQSRQGCARLVEPAFLGETRYVDSMTVGQFESLLNGFMAIADRLRVAACLIMSGSQSRIEQRVLRIVGAHADGLFDVVYGLFGSAIKGERTAEKAVRRGKVRIEIECALKLLNC